MQRRKLLLVQCREVGNGKRGPIESSEKLMPARDTPSRGEIEGRRLAAMRRVVDGDASAPVVGDDRGDLGVRRRRSCRRARWREASAVGSRQSIFGRRDSGRSTRTMAPVLSATTLVTSPLGSTISTIQLSTGWPG